MKTVGIIGARNIGASIAFFSCGTKNNKTILYDSSDGIAQGKSLDLMEAAPIRHFDTMVSNTQSLDTLLKTDIICIALEAPSATPASEFTTLLPQLKELAQFLKHYTGIVLIASRANEACTTVFSKLSDLNSDHVIGVGTLVDSMRIKNNIAQELGIVAEDVQAPVFGMQGSNAIIFPSYISVSGIPLPELISASKIQNIIKEVQEMNNNLLMLSKDRGVYYAQAAAAVEIIEAIIYNENRVLCSCTVGNFHIPDIALSTTQVINAKGIHTKMQSTLEHKKLSDIENTANQIRTIIGTVS